MAARAEVQSAGLGGMTEPLSADRIRARLDTDFIGHNLVYLPEVGSTNDEARHLARSGAPEGTLVITDHQTAGRGRLRRSWRAPPGSSLLMSVIFRPRMAPRQVQRLTMICGLAVADAIESLTGLRVDLKWPNDVVIAGAKVCGILTDVELCGEQVDYAVVGIGLNVSLDPAHLPDDLPASATSLSHVLGQPVARLPLLVAVLRAIEIRYAALASGHSPRAEWTKRLVTLDRQVRVVSIDSVVEGMAEGVDEDGALLVRLEDGRLERVLAGDVTLQPQAPTPLA